MSQISGLPATCYSTRKTAFCSVLQVHARLRSRPLLTALPAALCISALAASRPYDGLHAAGLLVNAFPSKVHSGLNEHVPRALTPAHRHLISTHFLRSSYAKRCGATSFPSIPASPFSFCHVLPPHSIAPPYLYSHRKFKGSWCYLRK